MADFDDFSDPDTRDPPPRWIRPNRFQSVQRHPGAPPSSFDGPIHPLDDEDQFSPLPEIVYYNPPTSTNFVPNPLNSNKKRRQYARKARLISPEQRTNNFGMFERFEQERYADDPEATAIGKRKHETVDMWSLVPRPGPWMGFDDQRKYLRSNNNLDALLPR